MGSRSRPPTSILEKPFTPQARVARVREVIDGSRMK
jgi:hypothetical protein